MRDKIPRNSSGISLFLINYAHLLFLRLLALSVHLIKVCWIDQHPFFHNELANTVVITKKYGRLMRRGR